MHKKYALYAQNDDNFGWKIQLVNLNFTSL